MKKLVISHGTLASGIKGALDIIIGNFHGLEAIDCFVDERSLEQLVNEYLETIDLENETLLVFTDLPAGSVNQYFLSKLDKDNLKLISGVNLPLILELVLLDEDSLTDERVNEAVEMAKEQIVYFDKTHVMTDTTDDFDF